MPGHTQTAPAGKSTVVSGAYQALWNDLDVGMTLDGYTLRQTNSGIDITADVTGDTVIDTIYSGTILSITMTLENWNAQAIEPMIWWHGNNNPAFYEWGLSDGVGQRHWDAAKPLILYSCHATDFSVAPTPGDPGGADVNTVISDPTKAGVAPANLNIDPLDIVFPKTLLRKDADIDVLFSFRPRFLTLTLDVFPISNEFDNTAWSRNEPDKVERISSCNKIRYFSATRGRYPGEVVV